MEVRGEGRGQGGGVQKEKKLGHCLGVALLPEGCMVFLCIVSSV